MTSLKRGMLSLAMVVAVLGAAHPTRAQASIDGRWEGAITIQGRDLRIIVTFKGGTGPLSATIDIPQQGAAGLSLTAVRRDGPAVHFELMAGPGLAVFDGHVIGEIISGDFTQGIASGTFSISRGGSAPPPAPPSPPPPYMVEEVSFSNGTVKLAGTLTRPKSAERVPAVVLISGSGAQNRDEDLYGFKVFGVLADHLTRQGIAVLRTDDRGVGGSSGSTADATSEDFAGDVLAAVAFLKARTDIDAGRIGLCGHSEGGLVAPMVASRSSDVAFSILLAGPALTGERIMLAQAAAISRAQGTPEPAIEKNAALQRRIFDAVRAGTVGTLRSELKQEGLKQIELLSAGQRKAIPDPATYVDRVLNAQLKMVESTWFRFFLDYDPAPALAKVRCPVLALFGELDLQVVPGDENRAVMKAAFEKGGLRDATITVVPKANHLFQAATTGSPEEYATLQKQFAPGVLDTLTTWIHAKTAARQVGRSVGGCR